MVNSVERNSAAWKKISFQDLQSVASIQFFSGGEQMMEAQIRALER